MTVAALLGLAGLALTGHLLVMLSWPCGRCYRRNLPWVKSCPVCLREMARRFR